MAMKYFSLSEGQELTEEQIQMLREAAGKPIVYDDDCPELTDEQIAEFRRVYEQKQATRRKQNVTLRLTPETIRKAKALGKGYTAILSRIIEGALNDPAILQKYL